MNLMEIETTIAVAALVIVLGILIATLKKFRVLKQNNDDLNERYSDLIDIDAALEKEREELQQLTLKIGQKRSSWETEFSETMREIKSLTDLLDSTRAQADAQSFGLYEPHFDFDTPDQYKEALLDNRAEQKHMIKFGEAAECNTDWHVEGSVAKGRQMVKRNLKLMLRAFNGESDAAIAKVKYNNVTALETRIEKAWSALNKLGKSNDCLITQVYLDLKLGELYLQHEFQESKHEEKEEQRRLKQQMREEERAVREIEKAKAEAEKEEARSAKALEEARAELKATGDAANEKMQAKITALEEKLTEAQLNKDRAISRAQMTKSGHVYIISNEGSFGKGIYKIGMTRRLEPMDRVKELSDASVPFSFDVHAMIYSENAPSLEADLHRSFDQRRVNMVNRRKEFFKVDLSEVESVVTAKNYNIQFTKMAEAEEFNKTLAVLRDQSVEAQRAAEAAEAAPAEMAAMSRLEKLKALNAKGTG
jgi:hypothetical protein